MVGSVTRKSQLSNTGFRSELPILAQNNSISTAQKQRSIDLEEGRKWWAFQPVAIQPVEPIRGDWATWPRNKIDHFVLARLAEQQLTPSPSADRDVLLQRAYLDLIGLRPTYEQIREFVNDDSAGAFERVVDQLLDSPHYGERWGRYWLDVVRYGEDNFTGEATTPSFPFAWRFRDWVIEAFNDDVPYDRFVKLQLAADLMPDVARRDFVALGFLVAAPCIIKTGDCRKMSSRRCMGTIGTNESTR